jgi:pyridoxamine 5'-phosphate oxidase
MHIANLRSEYNLFGLSRGDLDPDPIIQFKMWLEQAAGVRRSGRLRKFFIRLYKHALLSNGDGRPVEVNAATLATVGKDGRPYARIILLKDVDKRGFVFFSNYESRKGRDLAHNPCASLVFYWPDQERQVCISGDVSKISRQESEAYFKTRPRGSRLAAWASQQSEPVEGRDTLKRSFRRVEATYPGDEVPMPPYWGGYVLAPTRVEFWQGRPGRLHDRFSYVKLPVDRWHIERLCP